MKAMFSLIKPVLYLYTSGAKNKAELITSHPGFLPLGRFFVPFTYNLLR